MKARSVEGWLLFRRPILAGAAVLTVIGISLASDPAALNGWWPFKKVSPLDAFLLTYLLYLSIGILAAFQRLILLPRLEFGRRHLNIPSLGGAIATAAVLLAPIFVTANAGLIHKVWFEKSAFADAPALRGPFFAFALTLSNKLVEHDYDWEPLHIPEPSSEAFKGWLASAIRSINSLSSELENSYKNVSMAFPRDAPTVNGSAFDLKLLGDMQDAQKTVIQNLEKVLKEAEASPADAKLERIKSAVSNLRGLALLDKENSCRQKDPVCEILLIEFPHSSAKDWLFLDTSPSKGSAHMASVALGESFLAGPIGLICWGALSATIGLALRWLRLSESAMALFIAALIGVGAIGFVISGFPEDFFGGRGEGLFLAFIWMFFLLFCLCLIFLLPQLRKESVAALFLRFLIIFLPGAAMFTSFCMILIFSGTVGSLVSTGLVIAASTWWIIALDKGIILRNCRPG